MPAPWPSQYLLVILQLGVAMLTIIGAIISYLRPSGFVRRVIDNVTRIEDIQQTQHTQNKILFGLSLTQNHDEFEIDASQVAQDLNGGDVSEVADYVDGLDEDALIVRGSGDVETGQSQRPASGED